MSHLSCLISSLLFSSLLFSSLLFSSLLFSSLLFRHSPDISLSFGLFFSSPYEYSRISLFSPPPTPPSPSLLSCLVFLSYFILSRFTSHPLSLISHLSSLICNLSSLISHLSSLISHLPSLLFSSLLFSSLLFSSLLFSSLLFSSLLFYLGTLPIFHCHLASFFHPRTSTVESRCTPPPPPPHPHLALLTPRS